MEAARLDRLALGYLALLHTRRKNLYSPTRIGNTRLERSYLRQPVGLYSRCHGDVGEKDARKQGREKREVSHEHGGADVDDRARCRVTVCIVCPFPVSDLVAGQATFKTWLAYRCEALGETRLRPQIDPPFVKNERRGPLINRDCLGWRDKSVRRHWSDKTCVWSPSEETLGGPMPILGIYKHIT